MCILLVLKCMYVHTHITPNKAYTVKKIRMTKSILLLLLVLSLSGIIAHEREIPVAGGVIGDLRGRHSSCSEMYVCTRKKPLIKNRTLRKSE